MAEKRMFIYKITNLINKKIYIGRTVKGDICKRLNEHFSESKYVLNNSPLHKDMKIYNKEAFAIDKIAEIDFSSYFSADTEELKYIRLYNSLHANGYNKRKVAR